MLEATRMSQSSEKKELEKEEKLTRPEPQDLSTLRTDLGGSKDGKASQKGRKTQEG